MKKLIVLAISIGNGITDGFFGSAGESAVDAADNNFPQSIVGEQTLTGFLCIQYGNPIG